MGEKKEEEERKSDDDDDERNGFDLSMYDRTEIEAIETRCGVELESVDPKAISLAVSRAKELANGFFKSGKYEKSVEQYTAAIAGARKDKTLWRNRAAARLQVGERLEAIHDSVKAVELDEKDAKSWYR